MIDIDVGRKKMRGSIYPFLANFYLSAQNACHGTLKNTKIAS